MEGGVVCVMGGMRERGIAIPAGASSQHLAYSWAIQITLPKKVIILVKRELFQEEGLGFLVGEAPGRAGPKFLKTRHKIASFPRPPFHIKIVLDFQGCWPKVFNDQAQNCILFFSPFRI